MESGVGEMETGVGEMRVSCGGGASVGSNDIP